MNTKKIQQYILKLKDSFVEETDENKKMLDIYMKQIDGSATDSEIKEANYQLRQVLKSVGLGILVILPFSPISIPYVLKKAKEFDREEGSQIVILNFGALIEEAKSVASDFKATLIDMRFVKPLDESLLKKFLSKSDIFISIEDGSIMGGAGSAVHDEWFQSWRISTR